MWTKQFWKGLGERAIKTFFQSGVAATVTAGIASGVSGVQEVNWVAVGSVALLATVLSVATSIGNSNFTAGVPAAVVAIVPAGAHVAVVAPVDQEPVQ